VPRLYSTRAFVVCSLFGGPLSAVAFAALQARAMGRLRRDLPWLLLGLALFLAGAGILAETGLLGEAMTDLGTTHVPLVSQLVYRLVALGFCFAYWQRQQPEREQLMAAGITPEPGYGVGVVALLVGLVGGTLVLLALRTLAGVAT
jgi:energy-converting hydrogenase Eha subunit A